MKVVVAVVFDGAGRVGRCARARGFTPPGCPGPEGAEPAWFGGDQAGFEVWIADQSDTRPGYGGQLLIYDGAHLRGRRAAAATPIARLDLGGATADLCRAADRPESGAPAHDPVQQPALPRGGLVRGQRPRGDLRRRVANAAAVASRRPSAPPARDRRMPPIRRRTAPTSWSRTRTASGSSGSTPTSATNTFTHNPAATLDLATCTTPSGRPCEHPDLRPINWPICPIVDSSSTLRLRDAARRRACSWSMRRRTPMSIVAEYDKATVHGNGCGGIEVGRHMYINSGGSPVNVSSTNPHHPALYGFDVYRFPLSGYSRADHGQQPGADAAAQQERACPIRTASASRAAAGISG